MAADDPSNEKPISGDTKEEIVSSQDVANDAQDEKKQQPPQGDIPDMKSLTVEELYDKEKYDMSTMDTNDVLALLQ